MKLGIKELIFTALGVAGLAMMSFALGTLAGRGDIYRVLHNWGLLTSERGPVQMWGQAPSQPTTPVAPLASRLEIPAPPASMEPPSPKSPPMPGNIAALPKKPVQAEKKVAGKQTAKTKTDNLEKMRREVASKLKFQNSLDQAATRQRTPATEDKKASDKQATTNPRPSTSLMIVAKFRNVHHAQTKMAQMRQQGDKVVLKEGKDAEGRYFAICRPITVAEPKSPQIAQTKPNSPQVTETKLKKTKLETKPGKPAGR
ncbi:MAG: hypothetical protein ACOC6L_04315 [Thermodesulfobacteriota bacterium]